MKIDKCMIIPKIHIPMAMLSDNGMNNGFRYVLKSIKAIENVPNVLNVIRLLNSLRNLSWCKTSFNNSMNISIDPIIKNMLLKSVNILPNDKIAKIRPVIAKGRFFIMFIILV
jgi:hypothetical protein